MLEYYIDLRVLLRTDKELSKPLCSADNDAMIEKQIWSSRFIKYPMMTAMLLVTQSQFIFGSRDRGLARYTKGERYLIKSSLKKWSWFSNNLVFKNHLKEHELWGIFFVDFRYTVYCTAVIFLSQNKFPPIKKRTKA